MLKDRRKREGAGGVDGGRVLGLAIRTQIGPVRKMDTFVRMYIDTEPDSLDTHQATPSHSTLRRTYTEGSKQTSSVSWQCTSVQILVQKQYVFTSSHISSDLHLISSSFVNVYRAHCSPNETAPHSCSCYAHGFRSHPCLRQCAFDYQPVSCGAHHQCVHDISSQSRLTGFDPAWDHH